MTPLLFRQIWATVSSSCFRLEDLSDIEIAQAITQQTASDLSMSVEESQIMQRYVQTKMPLIRDLLESKAFGEYRFTT